MTVSVSPNNPPSDNKLATSVETMQYEAAWRELRHRAVAGGVRRQHVTGAASSPTASAEDNVVPYPARHDLQPRVLDGAQASPAPLPSQVASAQAPAAMEKAALERMVKEAIKSANDDLAWYNKRAKHVKRMSRGMRRWAIYLGVLGGLCPLLSESVFGVLAPVLGGLFLAVLTPLFNLSAPVLTESEQLVDAIGKVSASGTGLVCFALAGGFLLLDQVFGYSSSWMRYRLAELRLGKLVRTFSLEAESELAMCDGKSLPLDQAKSILARLKAFVAGLEDIRIEETETWVAEFKAGLLQMDQFTKTRGKSVDGQK
jgi:hypothetical protein